jgi:acetolactate synthase-1/2/3 large subunit
VTTPDAICEALESLGVDCVFGVPGTQTVDLFEALRARGIRTVLSTHELAAAFMAIGYYRASGRVGVLVTIPGPGLTYAVTGLAEASLDSAAIVHIVGPTPPPVPGRRFELQKIDQAGVVGPLVKRVVGVAGASAETVRSRIRSAFESARAGGPGPVVVDLGSAIDVEERPAPSSRPLPDWETLRSLLRGAARPLLLLGQGAIDSAGSLQSVAEARGMPILTTPSARGVVPEDHPLVMGFDVLRGGVDEANRLLDRADLVLVLGARLGHNGSAGFQLRIRPERMVHVDTDPAALGANYPARLCIEASVEDAAVVLASTTPSERSEGWSREELAAIRAGVRANDDAAPEPAVRGAQDGRARAFFSWLRAELPRDARLVTDSGQHQILARKYFDVLGPRGLIVPSDFQSMGFGLPAAIGARLADARPVAALIGDGGFLMSGMEALTVARERLPILIVVFNDGVLGQIRLQQLENHGVAHAVELRNPDFEALASAFGIAYARFGEHRPDEVRRAFDRAGPTLLEVRLGDSWSLRRDKAVWGTRGRLRRLLGPRTAAWVKGILRPGSA